MPSTREILVQLEYDAQGWQPSGNRGLLWLINECHRFMVSGDCWQHLYIDSSTGRPPYLTTTSGTYQYDAPSNCRKIFDIAVDSLSSYTPTVFYNYYNQLTGRIPGEKRNFVWAGRQYTRMEAYTTLALMDGVCTATFPFDPGTTTETYYLFYFKKPTEITAQTIELDIPEVYHEILIDGVLARIGKKSYGDVNAWEHWKRVIVPKQYWQGINNMHQPRTKYVPQRPC